MPLYAVHMLSPLVYRVCPYAVHNNYAIAPLVHGGFVAPTDLFLLFFFKGFDGNPGHGGGPGQKGESVSDLYIINDG